MIYSKSVTSLSLLLGASSAVSAAATLPYRDAGPPRSYTDISLVVAESSEPKPKHVVDLRRAPGPDNPTSPVGSQSPQSGRIVTTKEVSDIAVLAKSTAPGSSPSTLLANPLRSTMDLLDLQQTTSGLITGRLDLMTPSDEGSQKIATLGYSGDVSGQPPFELWSEKQTGSLVFLDPTPASQNKQKPAPTISSSNHSMAILVTRAVPFGLLPDLNLTDLAPRPLPESIQGGNGPTTSELVIVRIRAALTDKLELKDSPCATYYREPNRTDDWVPMRFLTCDNSYLSDTPAAPRGISETQLWQYNPGTHEVKPMLMSVISEATTEAFDSSTPSVAQSPGGPTPPNPAPGTIATPTLPLLAEVAGVSNGDISQASSTTLTMASQARKADGDEGRSPPRSARRAALRRQGPASPFIAAPIVDPYTLVFYPRVAEEAHSVLPPSI